MAKQKIAKMKCDKCGWTMETPLEDIHQEIPCLICSGTSPLAIDDGTMTIEKIIENSEEV